LASERDLNADLAEKLKELDQTPSKERALIEISRQQEIKNEIYAFLLQKREEAAISLASTIADIRVL